MSSHQTGRKKNDGAKPSPPSRDVHMRSLTSDEDTSPAKDSSRPVPRGSSDRRRNFDASKLRKPEVVVTYTAPLSQDSQSTNEAVATGGSVGRAPVLEGDTNHSHPALLEVEPVDFHLIPDPDFRSLQSLNAVLISSNFLRHHIKDLVWIKARLVEHQSHIVQCRNLTMKNLNSIERALYTEEKFAQLGTHFEGRDE